MADPVSIISLAATVGQIISSIYDYGMNVKGAQSDIQSLSQELFALKGVMEHIGAQQNNNVAGSGLRTSPLPARYDPDQFSHVLRTTESFLNSLLRSLEEPKDKFKKAMQGLTWPFRKGDMNYILHVWDKSRHVTQTTYSKVLELEQSLNADRETREREKADSATQELLTWLAPVGPGEAHARAMQVRQHGTGSWFIDGPFRQWLNAGPGHSPVLWLSGSSGSGKTVLLSYAIETAKNTFPEGSGMSIGYYYCSFDNSASLLPVNVLGSLAAQLSIASPMLLEALRPIFEKKLESGKPRSLDLTELEDLILKYSATLPTVLFFIDALNESNYHSSITASLLSLTKKSKSLRILVTSTSDPPHTGLTGLPMHRVINVQPERVAEDIQTYVESRLKGDPNLQLLSEMLKEDIRKALVNRSGGMFRWAQLSLLHLSAQRTGRDVRNALELIPQDLDKTYASILCRISEADRRLAREAFTWLSFAERPLYISELCEAVVVRESDTTLDSDSRLHSPHAIVEICQGLAQRDSSRVTLAHSSIKDFLVSEWIISSPAKFFGIEPAAARKTLMRKCLAYLCFQDFKSGYRKYPSDYAARLRAFPFLQYAATNWATYANYGELDAEDYHLIAKFLATKKLSRGGNFSSWIQCLTPRMLPEQIEAREPLYYIASFGLLPLVRSILTSQPDIKIDARGGRFSSTPLFVALWHGHLQVVELLLEHGADPRLMDPSTGFTPLSYARAKPLGNCRSFGKVFIPL